MAKKMAVKKKKARGYVGDMKRGKKVKRSY